jgi:hypothetical protein
LTAESAVVVEHRSQLAGQNTMREPVLKAIALAALAWTLVASAASAGEQISIPYRCRTVGPSIELIPSGPRQYEIIGRREQEIVTNCAKGDQNRCKSWRVHKFDINCGGERVPWIDVVAAANARTRGPARVQGNTLFVRMDPWWARGSGDGHRRQLREYGEDDQRPTDFRYRPTGREREMQMPPGFAPMVGIRGQFTEATHDTDREPENGYEREPYGERPGPVAGLETERRPMPSVSPKAAPQAPIPTLKPPLATESKPAPKPVVEAPSSGAKTTLRDSGHTFAAKPSESKPEPTKPEVKTEDVKANQPKPVETQPVVTAPPTAPPTFETQATNTAPKLVNGPDAVEPPKPEGPTVITSASSSAGDAAGPNGTQIAAAPSVAVPVLVDPIPTGALPAQPVTLPIVLLVGALILLAATAAQWMRRQNRVVVPAPADRNISDVWLETSTTPDLATFDPLPLAPPRQPDIDLGPEPVSAVIAAGPAVNATWVPTTRDEALQVLGAGPDASAAVLKKIVDGLRMSWHPDHAKTPEEYTARHERMRQINVAWDVLSEPGANPTNHGAL